MKKYQFEVINTDVVPMTVTDLFKDGVLRGLYCGNDLVSVSYRVSSDLLECRITHVSTGDLVASGYTARSGRDLEIIHTGGRKLKHWITIS